METQQPALPTSYICGPCGMKFEGADAVEQYRNHTCSVSGFKPTDPKNLGPEFEAVSKAAQERGAQYKIETQPPQ